MDIIPKKLQKTSHGWKTVFSVQLNSDELLQLQNSQELLPKYFKGYEITLEDNILFLSRNFKIMEPWEDETPEAVMESVQMEIKYLFKKIIMQ